MSEKKLQSKNIGEKIPIEKKTSFPSGNLPTDKKTSTEQYEKPSYDENIHKKNRHQKHTKRRSMKKKSKMMYEHLCQEYDNFMIANQVKKKNIVNHHTS